MYYILHELRAPHPSHNDLLLSASAAVRHELRLEQMYVPRLKYTRFSVHYDVKTRDLLVQSRHAVTQIKLGFISCPQVASYYFPKCWTQILHSA